MSDSEFAELCRALIARRKTLGLTKMEVAKRMGRHSSYMTGLETGYPRYPSPALLRSWAQALYCDLHFDATLTYTKFPEPPRMFDVTPDVNIGETE